MRRMERFARYAFAPWPDAALLEAAARFRMPVVVQVVQNFRSGSEPRLLIEVEDGEWQAQPDGTPGTLRLTWDFTTVYALESYDEFYSRPYAHAYAWKKDSKRRFLHEIVSEPDAWIEELLADNPDTGVFPMSGSPVMVREDLREQNPAWGEPTGRFFPPTARLEDGGTHPMFFKASGEPLTPPDEAEIERRKSAMREEMLGKPRYRHLFIASESHMLEVLCGDLPTWAWVEASEVQG
jgi:hypothetical protein